MPYLRSPKGLVVVACVVLALGLIVSACETVVETPAPADTPVPAETPTPVETPVEPDDDQAMAEQLWQTMQDANYTEEWSLVPGKGELYRGQTPHGALITTYLSQEVMDALNAGDALLPDGAIIVKENYAEDESLQSITVMQKVAGYDADHNDWFWVGYGPTGNVDAAGRVPMCISCHGAVRSNDYVFTVAIAVEQVADVPATDEDMAIAAELWQTMQDEDYREQWATVPGKGTFYQGQPPHGALLSTFLNALAAEAMNAQADEMPDGAVIVKENYTADQVLINATVMLKRAAYDPDHNDWFWAAFTPEGEIAMAGQAAMCIGCHAAVRSNDYIFTFPLAFVEP
jgi:hypothetical protein